MLEVLSAIRKGKCIRTRQGEESTTHAFYILESEEKPIGIKRILKFSADVLADEDEAPISFVGIVTTEDIFKEIYDEWRSRQK